MLPDGRVGKLMFIHKTTRRAKVHIAGRHFMAYTHELRLIITHMAPPMGAGTPCCDRLPASMEAHDRVTTTASEVTCPGP